MVAAGQIPRFSRALGAFGAAGAFLAGGAVYMHRSAAQAQSVPDAATKPGVYLWGDNSKGLISSGMLSSSSIRVPTRVPFLDNQRLKSLAVCPEYALAALSNGDVVQWTSPEQNDTVLKSKKVVNLQISPKSHIAVALAQNGSVWTWRAPASAGSADGETVESSSPVQVQFATKLGWFEKIVDVKCGADHLAALSNKGRVYVAALTQADEHHGQFGIAAFPHFEKTPEPNQFHMVRLLNAPVKQIACGIYHTLFLTKSGDLYGCGSNMHGQLMLPYTLKNTKVSVPTRLPFPASTGSAVAAIGAGSLVSCFQPQGSDAWYIAGDGEYGQFGTGSFAHCQVSPLRVAALDSMREYDEARGRVVPLTVAADGWKIGETHVYAAVDNAVRDWLVWGSNERGQLGNNKLSKLVKPTPVPSTVVDYNSLGASEFVVGDKISGCYAAAK